MHSFAQNAPLATLPAFLNAATALLNAILKSFPPRSNPQSAVNTNAITTTPSPTPIRAEYLLRLTSDIADAILSYEITDISQLDSLFDFFSLLDNAWVTVLEQREDVSSSNASTNTSTALSTGVSTTQRVRLRNLILLIKDSCSDLESSKNRNSNNDNSTITDTETETDTGIIDNDSSLGNASHSSADEAEYDSDNFSLDQVSVHTPNGSASDNDKNNSNATTTSVSFNVVDHYQQSARSIFHNTLTLLAEL